MVKPKKSLCRSRTLNLFVREVKVKFKKQGLKPPTTERIVQHILRKHRVKAEDIIKDEIIRF